jgi:hypothetical protein
MHMYHNVSLMASLLGLDAGNIEAHLKSD